MATDSNKENLRKLLAFMNQQILHKPENAWFVDELYSILPKREDKTINKIEKYLSLDFELDSAESLIDFSFVNDKFIKNCFISDFREMLRYRFGTRAHKIDFSEFCRYVIIIAERLLNYYYAQYGDIETIKQHIIKFNPNATIDKAQSVEGINFSVKLWSYTTQYNLDKIKRVLDRVREVRNSQSHGSIMQSDDENFYKQEHDKLVKDGYPLMVNGLVDWDKLQTEKPGLWGIYNSNVKATPNHQKYIKIAWLRSMPFKQIYDSLCCLAEDVSKNIK
jgi:hypothetical protein